MDADLLTLYRRSTDWAAEKVAGAADLDAATPCDDWRLRDLLSHMLLTQRYFLAAARGEAATPPGANPPDLLTDDPAAEFRHVQAEVIEAFGQEGVIDKTGPALGVAFADSLLHGWDVARASGQDETMPDGLAQAAYDFIHGRFTDEERVGIFAPALPVRDDATPQQRLLAYTGRDPG